MWAEHQRQRRKLYAQARDGIVEWMAGPVHDPVTGLHHLINSGLFLIKIAMIEEDLNMAGTAVQDRPSGKGPAIAERVQQDIADRAELGLKTYGEKLRAHNGRDALIDAYQEALDLCMYLRQVIEERTA